MQKSIKIFNEHNRDFDPGDLPKPDAYLTTRRLSLIRSGKWSKTFKIVKNKDNKVAKILKEKEEIHKCVNREKSIEKEKIKILTESLLVEMKGFNDYSDNNREFTKDAKDMFQRFYLREIYGTEHVKIEESNNPSTNKSQKEKKSKHKTRHAKKAQEK
jgi:hypothetical protein